MGQLPKEAEELEAEISLLQNQLIDGQEKLERIVKTIANIQKTIESVTTALKRARSNLTHMRKKADHVVMQEFQAVKKSEKDLAGELEDLQVKLASTKSLHDSLLGNQPLIKTAIKARKDKLKEFGKVAPIRRRKKAK
jgi:chromosome segregation ATPase